MLVARRFSITNFVIASSALGFQVLVLYPWHKKLDDDFTELKNEQIRIMRESQALQERGLGELRKAIDGLAADRRALARS